MESLADAVARALSYIDYRDVGAAEGSPEYDRYIDAVTGILAGLRFASPAELDALAAAAERALATPEPRPAFVDYYRRWMEQLFGGRWRGNRLEPAPGGDGP